MKSPLPAFGMMDVPMPTPYLLLFFKKVEPFVRCEGVYVQETVDVICWLGCVAFPGV